MNLSFTKLSCLIGTWGFHFAPCPSVAVIVAIVLVVPVLLTGLAANVGADDELVEGAGL